MKFFLVIVVCMWGECENFISTDPTFDSREACREYSQSVVAKIQQQLPDSEGKTYCFDEEQLKHITDELLKDWQKQPQESDPAIKSI